MPLWKVFLSESYDEIGVGLEIERESLRFRGKASIAMGIALLALSWVVATYYYRILPDTVPTHYDLYGRPNGWGSKASLLLAPAILTGVGIALLAVIKYRYTMIERYPYLVNMPAFMILVSSDRLTPTERSSIVNMVFEVISIELALLGLLGLEITYFSFTMVTGGSSIGLFSSTLYTTIAIMIAIPLFLFYKTYTKIKTMLSTSEHRR